MRNKKKLVLHRETIIQLQLIRGGWDPDPTNYSNCLFEGCNQPASDTCGCTLGTVTCATACGC